MALQVQRVATLVDNKVPTVELGGAGADGTKFLRGDQVWGAFEPLYLGDPEIDGCWRFKIDGNNLIVERRETGEWKEKSSFLA